jgi:hypothetical protein
VHLGSWRREPEEGGQKRLPASPQRAAQTFGDYQLIGAAIGETKRAAVPLRLPIGYAAHIIDDGDCARIAFEEVAPERRRINAATRSQLIHERPETEKS